MVRFWGLVRVGMSGGEDGVLRGLVSRWNNILLWLVGSTLIRAYADLHSKQSREC